MPETRLKMNEEIYRRLIEEDKSKHGPYSAFMANMNSLITKQNEILNQINDKNGKKISDKDFGELETYFNKAESSINALLDSNDPFVKARKHMLVDMIKSAKRDRVFFSEAIGKKRSPQQIKEEKETVKVDITGKKTNVLGASNSSRIAIQSSDGTKGYFTRKSKGDYRSAREQVFNQKTNNIPAKLKEQIHNSIFKNWTTAGAALNTAVKEEHELLTEADGHRAENLNILMEQMGFSQELKNEINHHADIQAEVGNLLNALGKQAFKEEITEFAGINQGMDISKRNVTMYELAKKVGCDHLIAKSVNMKLVDGDKTVEGIFMENVTGKDINNLPADDPMNTITEEGMNNGEFLHQLADLQMLDFIAGNVDRHMGNMIYDLQKNENGTYYLKGIKGIDNDMSFGHLNKAEGRMVDPKYIDHVSENMYNMLKKNGFAEEIENMLLLGGYSKKEAQAAGNRVRLLQNRIIFNRENPPVVVKKEEWDNLKLKDLARGNGRKDENIFSSMVRLQETLNKGTYKKEDAVRDMDHFFAEAKDAEQTTLEHNELIKFVKHANKMSYIDTLRKPSKEFKDMREKLYEIQRFTQTKLDDKQPLSDKEREDLKKLTAELVGSCKHYLNLKKLVPRTETGVERQKYAVDLCSFAEKMLERNFAMDDKEEKLDDPEAEQFGL